MRTAPRPSWVARLATFAPLIGFGACHHPPGPERVLDEYVAHLKAGRVSAAYALTTPAYRADRSLAAFAVAVAQQPLFERAPRERARRERTVELSAHRPPLQVVQVGARLCLSKDPLDLYPSETPEDALRSFARAVALGRRERILLLLAPALRDRIAADAPLPPPIVEAGRAIERGLDTPRGPLVLDGTSARWLAGEGLSLALERGPTGWWITSL